MICDVKLEELKGEEFDMIVAPGGIEGSETLGKSELFVSLIKNQLDAGKYIGAICAAPYNVLEKNGFLKG